MYRAHRLAPLSSVLLLAVVVLVFALGAINPATAEEGGAAAAPEPSADVVVLAERPAGAPVLSTPVPVSELTDKRTATSRTYRLSDGTKQVEIFQRAINYLDAQGAWQPIDVRLVPGSVAGTYKSAATPVKVSVSLDKAKSQPVVSLSYEGASVSLRPVDFPGMSLVSAPSVTDGRASFGRAWSGPVLSYEVIGEGVKETISLPNASSPNTYLFEIGHAGLTLVQDETGQWGFCQAGETAPALLLGDLVVFDSSVDETGSAAYARGATMKIEPGKEASTATITVPKAWLADPARVFPVLIDPTVTLPASNDTYVRDVTPNDYYGTSPTINVGRYDAATGWNRGLVEFTLPADLTSAGGGFVISANLKLYQYWQYYASTPMATHVGVMTKDWNWNSTWNTLQFTSAITDVINAKSISVARNQWLDLPCADIVQNWASGTQTNYGFLVYQMPTEGQTYWRQFRSSNYSSDTTYEPKLVVNYTAVYNVKTGYGAQGNGTTDDTTSIQNAINAAGIAGGGRVYFPAGTYLITQPLVVGKNYVTLEGVEFVAGTDPTSVIKVGAATQTEAIRLGATTSVTGSSVKSLGIEVPDGGDGVKVTGTGGGSAITVAYNVFTGALVDNTSSGVSVASNFSNATVLGNDFSGLGALALDMPVSASGRSVNGNTMPVSQSYRSDLLWGSDRYDTAIRLSKAAYPNAFASGQGTVVLVSGENFPDALSVAPLAVAYDAPTLLTYATVLTVSTATELKRLNPKQVFVVGLGSAVQNGVKETLPTATVTAIVGTDRYDTAARVATQLKAKLGSVSRVVVVPGDNYPDGIAVASLAAHKGWAILLTPAAGPLPSVTYNCYHTTLGVNTALEVGSYVALPGITNLTRIIGATRYDTSAQVAQYAESLDGDIVFNHVGLATGDLYPDALAVGSYLGKKGGVLLLTQGQTVTAPVQAELDEHFSWLDELTYVALPNLWNANQNSAAYLEPAPRHTAYDLGEFAGHYSAATLDEARLDVSTTDLAIATFGPTTALSRIYSSDVTTAGYFAPGWRFGFERSLTFVDETLTRYTDEVGDSYAFVKNGESTWSPPPGSNAKLEEGVSDWTLTFPGSGTTLTFDGTSGRLLSEADRNGNAVNYTWTSGYCTAITAANGQQIQLTLNGSHKLTQAVYSTSEGTRQVNYAAAAPWSVTYYPGTSLAHTASYAYSSMVLSSITADDFTGTTDATESFLYTNGALTEVRFPDHTTLATFPDYNNSNADARATITYNGLSADVSRWGAVYSTGAPTGQTGTQVTKSFSWDERGALLSETNFKTASEPADTWSYTVSELAEATVEVGSPLLTSINYSYTSRLGIKSVTDEAGATETATYPADSSDENWDLPLTVTDRLGAVTSYVYDAGQPVEVTRQLNAAGDLEVTRYTYADVTAGSATFHGALIQEQKLVSGTPENGTWAVTDYDTGLYYPNGEPEKTVYRDVALEDGQQDPPDLTITKTCDAFGNPLTETDTSGQVIVTNTYGLDGRLLTSTGPSFDATVDGNTVSTQIVSNRFYDAWGHETQSYSTSTGDASGEKDDWTTTTYDASGRAFEVKKWLWTSSAPSGTVQSTANYRYDGMGRQITQTDTTVSGLSALSAYDAWGNLVASWRSGACLTSYELIKALRSVNADGTPAFDALGRTLRRARPGENSTTYSYYADSQVHTETRPDGTSTTFVYDEGGNTAEAVSSESGTTSLTYDLAGRCLSTTTQADLTTEFGYDLLGRQVSAGAEGQTSSQTVYNTPGWQLATTDADGFASTWVYDAAGRVVSEALEGATTQSSYDAAGNLTHREDPDDREIDVTYDLFGRANETIQTLPGSPRVLISDVAVEYDSLGRPTQITDTVRDLAHSYTYPLNVPTATSQVIGVGSTGNGLVTTTAMVGTDGLETSRHVQVESSPQIPAILRTIDTRDSAQRVTKSTTDAGAATDIYTQVLYDSAGRLERQWGPDSGAGSGYLSAAASTTAYTYSSTTGRKTADNLQLQSVGTAGPLVSSYTYSADGRLSTATTGGATETDTFDAAGNLTSIGTGTSLTYTSNRLATMTAGGATNVFAFDADKGWRTAQGPSGDPDTITFAYTGSGRLATYQDESRALTATYSYDAEGQRTHAQVAQTGQDTQVTDYLYEGITLLGLSASKGSASWKITYLYDETGSLYGGVYRSPADTTSPVFFGVVATDRGDVVELLDAAGAPFAAYRYDAWGNPQGAGNVGTGIWSQGTALVTSTLATDIAQRQLLRYASYCFDQESGMYYLSARHYDPVTRQFLSKDPAKDDGEASAYQYCAGNPVESIDPDGTAGYVRGRWYPWGSPIKFTAGGGKIWIKYAVHFNFRLSINGFETADEEMYPTGAQHVAWYLAATGSHWDTSASPNRIVTYDWAGKKRVKLTTLVVFKLNYGVWKASGTVKTYRARVWAEIRPPMYGGVRWTSQDFSHWF